MLQRPMFKHKTTYLQIFERTPIFLCSFRQRSVRLADINSPVCCVRLSLVFCFTELTHSKIYHTLLATSSLPTLRDASAHSTPHSVTFFPSWILTEEVRQGFSITFYQFYLVTRNFGNSWLCLREQLHQPPISCTWHLHQSRIFHVTYFNLDRLVTNPLCWKGISP